MISFKQKGDFSKLNTFAERAKEVFNAGILDRYGKAGVAALKAATPVDTGTTADSWYYTIKRSNGSATISWCNSNIQNEVLVAILIQYGHATGNGGWVQGSDFINPAMKSIFENLADEAWKEITTS